MAEARVKGVSVDRDILGRPWELWAEVISSATPIRSNLDFHGEWL